MHEVHSENWRYPVVDFSNLYGLITVAGLVFSNMNLVLGGLAIAAGIFLLIER